jgi:hypothetical protein
MNNHHHQYQNIFDPLAAARGILVAVAIMIPFWIILAVLILYL